MNGRLVALRELGRIQEMLIGEIRYGKSTLPECCSRIAEHIQEPYQSAFFCIYDRMNEHTGEGFREVFSEEMRSCLEKLPVTGEDGKTFLSLFSSSGFGDDGMQIRMIEQSRELLGQTIDRLERENREKCRMAVGLGAMSGLLLLIILI